MPLRLNSSSLTGSICALTAIILQLVTMECQKLHMVDSLIGSQFISASPWRVGTCRWRVDGDRRLSNWLSFAAAVRKIEGRLDCVNVRPTLSQWQRRRSPSSTWNYVSTRKQQNTLQLTTIEKIAVWWKLRWAIWLKERVVWRLRFLLKYPDFLLII